MDHNSLIKAMIRSQRCQRNWDLSKTIPEEDIKVIEAAATQCPSKQNVTFYKPIFVTNRDVIQKIHDASMLGGTVNKNTNEFSMLTQSQLLANLLVVLVEDFNEKDLEESPSLMSYHKGELQQYVAESHLPYYNDDKRRMLELMLSDYKRDKDVAVGIAAGYMNLAASLLGYATGCCQCFDKPAVKNILNVSGDILLIMGIGFKDESRNRREHHLYPDEVFTTKSKHIKVETIV